MSQNWLIYVLELSNNRFYVGNCRHLGKALGAHFHRKSIAWTRDNPVVKLIELIVVDHNDNSFSDRKQQVLLGYISQYGWENVLGSPMPGKKGFI